MTLITFGTSGGVRRRCDATCHNAKQPHCTCICGGRYHGKREGSEELKAEVMAVEDEVLRNLNSRQLERLGITLPAPESAGV